MTKRVPVGIDLGTTFCAAASFDDDGTTQMIPKADGSVLTPSVIYFDDDAVVVGQHARELSLTHPERSAESPKRDMGRAAYRHRVMDREWPPEVLQACLLRDLGFDVARACGEGAACVITVPAYFDEARRKATADAGAMSGLTVLDIVNEPTAAALAFGEKLGFLDAEGEIKDRQRIVVYDLGGGTFDVTVLDLQTGVVVTLATDGDFELGGLDWDERLCEKILERFHSKYPARDIDAGDRLRLRHAATQAKHELTDAPLAAIDLTLAGARLVTNVTRDDFAEWTIDLLERTLFTTRQALSSAGLLWKDIDRLILVGGSSRMPMVRAHLQKMTGLVPDTVVHPDEAVARGAAIYARYVLGLQGETTDLPKLKITDVNSHSLGIEGVNLGTLRHENVRLIPRNTPLPYTIKRSFVTKVDNQRSVKVRLLEGESSVVEQCGTLATAAIKHLPPGLPKGTKVTVSYTFLANGRLEVEAAVDGYGNEAHIELERISGVPGEVVQRWKPIVCQHGGYASFEQALDELLVQRVLGNSRDENDQGDLLSEASTPTKPKPTLVPAVDHGAPRAAADKLASHRGGGVPKPTTETKPTPIKFDPVAEPTSDSDDDWRPPPRGNYGGHSALYYIVGYLLSATVGLGLGYYLLSWVRPDLNFLNLSLPGIESKP